MTFVYVVQDTETNDIIGVYDTLESAETSGEIWTSAFIIIPKILNSPPDIDSKACRKPSVTYFYKST